MLFFLLYISVSKLFFTASVNQKWFFIDLKNFYIPTIGINSTMILLIIFWRRTNASYEKANKLGTNTISDKVSFLNAVYCRVVAKNFSTLIIFFQRNWETYIFSFFKFSFNYAINGFKKASSSLCCTAIWKLNFTHSLNLCFSNTS